MQQPDFNFVILYVESPSASAAFYSKLLGLEPVEYSPVFALFVMWSGVKLGLWARQHVEPKATVATASKGEIIHTVADAEAVRALHADWSGRGLAIAQPPTAMDFGHTFVALDPDGHRLRVFAPTQP